LGRLNRLTRLFHRLRRSFWLLPMLGCLAGCALAILSSAMDRNGLLGDMFAIEADAARDLMGVIAGATATMMSLTYTLTLLIFTLAAGQLGPRLLDSFYDNRVNQLTITMIGTTFVFAMVGLYLVSDDHEARTGTVTAIVLAVAGVMTLIYFVHDVARRVLVDNEIAVTARRLRMAFDGAFRDHGEDPQPAAIQPERDEGEARVIHATRTGYLRSIDLDELVKDMAKHDAMVEIVTAPGEFVVERASVALVHRAGTIEDWEKTVNGRLVLSRARSSEGDILFSVNLLVEIALRALSPGINDSFTAISAIDHMSGAFADLLHRQPASPLYLDEDGVARVTADALSATQIVNTAFHPIRRNAAGNMLVSCAMLDAIRRMVEVSDDVHLPLLRHHADLVSRSALGPDALDEDREYLAGRLLTVMPQTA